MHEVETPELLEVQLVNAIAPFILNARLKPLMLKTPERHKHVVNVSAMEGQFYRTTKTDRHPHTNMAKAALNMMTRTSALDFVKDGIHMNAVDTGWVTDEDPPCTRPARSNSASRLPWTSSTAPRASSTRYSSAGSRARTSGASFSRTISRRPGNSSRRASMPRGHAVDELHRILHGRRAPTGQRREGGHGVRVTPMRIQVQFHPNVTAHQGVA